MSKVTLMHVLVEYFDDGSKISFDDISGFVELCIVNDVEDLDCQFTSRQFVDFFHTGKMTPKQKEFFSDIKDRFEKEVTIQTVKANPLILKKPKQKTMIEKMEESVIEEEQESTGSAEQVVIMSMFNSLDKEKKQTKLEEIRQWNIECAKRE